MCTGTRHVQPCCCVHQSQDLFAGKTPENGMVHLVCMMQGERECPETEEDEEQGQEESTDDEDTEDELEREIMEQKM